ncbi:MAG TPA: hypothetical protein VEW28_01335 [Candidatus Kapabacteria bacterium]|nr:hypothetical protein [Candidatus Kapabacteria bacterium]
METVKSLILKSIFERRLFTLKDMKEFNADAVYHIGGQMKLATAVFKEPLSWFMQKSIVDQQAIETATKIILLAFEKDKIKENIDMLGLTHSKKQLRSTIEVLQRRPITNLSLIDMHSAIDGLERIIESEIEECKFLWLLSDEAEKFDNNDPFELKEHSALYIYCFDVVSASKCLALDQQTAAVFHLMRIIESVSQLLGKKLGVQPLKNGNPIAIEDAQWDQILTLIDNQVEDFRVKKNLSNVHMDIQADPDKYKNLVFSFRLMKDIWRNPVAHPHIFIGVPPAHKREGWKIYDAVGLFLNSLKPLLP